MKLKMFYTPHCSQCPKQEDIIEELASEEGVEYEFVDATKNTDEANQYSVQSAPTTVVFQDEAEQQVQSQHIGLTPKDDLRSELN